MALTILPLSLGSMDNNTVLLADPDTRQAVVVDPSFESEQARAEAERRGWQITAIWLTHAHFDHIAGIQAFNAGRTGPLPIGLHPADLPLYHQAGGARLFGVHLEPGPEPSLAFAHGQILRLGRAAVEVRHTPGHTPGHVIFYLAEEAAALCGDLIFYRGVGRTDLPGASHAALLHSIRTQVFTLPPATRLLCGHGPETQVAEEMAENPFLS